MVGVPSGDQYLTCPMAHGRLIPFARFVVRLRWKLRHTPHRTLNLDRLVRAFAAGRYTVGEVE